VYPIALSPSACLDEGVRETEANYTAGELTVDCSDTRGSNFAKFNGKSG